MSFTPSFGSLKLLCMLLISIEVVGGSRCTDAADEYSMTVLSMCSSYVKRANGIVIDMSPMTSSAEMSCKCNAYVHGAASDYTVSFFDFQNIKPYENCGSSVDVGIGGQHEFTFNCKTLGSMTVNNGQQFSLILNKDEAHLVNADYCILILADGGSTSNISISCEGDPTSSLETTVSTSTHLGSSKDSSGPTNPIMDSSTTTDDSAEPYSTMKTTYNTNGQSTTATSILTTSTMTDSSAAITYISPSPTDHVTGTNLATGDSTDDTTELIKTSVSKSTDISATSIVPTKTDSRTTLAKSTTSDGNTSESVENSFTSTVDIPSTAIKHTSINSEGTHRYTINTEQDVTPLLQTSNSTDIPSIIPDTESTVLSHSAVSQSSTSPVGNGTPTTRKTTNLSTRKQEDNSDSDDEIILIFVPIVAVVVVLLVIVTIAVYVAKRRRKQEQRQRLIENIKNADKKGSSFSNWILQEPGEPLGIVNNSYNDVSEVEEILPPFDSSVELTNVTDTDPQNPNIQDEDIQTKWTIVNNNESSIQAKNKAEDPEPLYSSVQKPKPRTDKQESDYIATPPNSPSSYHSSTENNSPTMNENDKFTYDTNSPKHKSIIKVRSS